MSSSEQCASTLRQWVEVFMRLSMRNFILHAKESGLSMPHIGALMRICHKDAPNVSEISAEMGVSRAAASQMLERLAQQGLIARAEDPNDRRVKQVIITERGRQVVQAALHARQVWMNDLVNALSPAEQEQVTAALNILIERAQMNNNTPKEVTQIPLCSD